PSLALPPTPPTLFPYTTLFRSPQWPRPQHDRLQHRGRARAIDCARDHAGNHAAVAARREFRAFRGRGERAHSRRWLYADRISARSEEHTSELQSRFDIVCRLLL